MKKVPVINITNPTGEFLRRVKAFEKVEGKIVQIQYEFNFGEKAPEHPLEQVLADICSDPNSPVFHQFLKT